MVRILSEKDAPAPQKVAESPEPEAGAVQLRGKDYAEQVQLLSPVQRKEDGKPTHAQLPDAPALDGWLAGAVAHIDDVMSMSGGKLGKLVKMIGHERSKTDPAASLLDAMVHHSAVGEKVIQTCFSVRYKITKWKKTWGVEPLREIWKIFSVLPEEHTSGTSDEMPTWVRGKGGSYASDRGDQITIGYNDKDAAYLTKTRKDIEADPNRDPNQKHEGDETLGNVALFGLNVLHEIGHAVDFKVHASSSWGASPSGGGWINYASNNEAALAAIMAAADKENVEGNPTAAELAILQKVLLDGMTKSPDGIDKALNALETKKQLEPGRAAILAKHPAVVAVKKGAKGGAHNDPNLGPELGGRRYHYQRSEVSGWVSYLSGARDPGKRVSEYQFYSPYEFFAEQYAAYFSAKDGEGRYGKLLRAKDPAAAEFFDAHINQKNAELQPDDFK